MPQPRTDTDLDLAVYKGADATIKAGEAVARALPSIPPIPTAKIGTGLLVVAGVVVVVGVAGLSLASRFTPVGMIR